MLAATLLTLGALGAVPAAFPAPETRYAVAAGYSGGHLDLDVARGDDESFNTSGLGLLGRAHLSPRWNLQLKLTSRDEDFAAGGTLEHDEVLCDALYTFLTEPFSGGLELRFYGSFGVGWATFDESLAGASASDQALHPVVGVGLEWGSPRWALVFDFEWGPADVRLLPGEKESVGAGGTILGLIYKF